MYFYYVTVRTTDPTTDVIYIDTQVTAGILKGIPVEKRAESETREGWQRRISLSRIGQRAPRPNLALRGRRVASESIEGASGRPFAFATRRARPAACADCGWSVRSR